MSPSKTGSRLILFVTAELAPFSKVGGLGEVCAALPAALRRHDEDVRVFTPWHGSMDIGTSEPVLRGEGRLRFAGEERRFKLFETTIPGTAVPVYLLRAPDFFEVGDDFYGETDGPGGLGRLRWLFFSAALRPACAVLELSPDILHCHDWHAALVPVLERTDHAFDDAAAMPATVLTVHNAAFQGRHSLEDWRRARLREDVLNPWHLLEDGDANLLKGGIVFSDRITTVSPGYASEIQTAAGGAGLHLVFESRRDAIDGVVNGIDLDVWNPGHDPAIASAFDAEDPTGKAECRRALLAELGLDAGPGPVIAVVSRLVEQKGIDLILEILPRLLRRRQVRLVVLGRGESELEVALRSAAAEHPGRVAARIDFDEDLAHRIFAGADLLLIPSRFEPCGLTQLTAMRYGTLPVVRITGGLGDTVVPYDGKNLREATGFAFDEIDADELFTAIERALVVYRRPASWKRLQRTAMCQDVGWDAIVDRYQRTYDAAQADRAAGERDETLHSHLRLEPDGSWLPELRAIPSHYERDILHLMAKDPRTVFAYWEVQGEAGREHLEGLDDDQRYRSRWELRFEDIDSGVDWTIDVEGYGKNWFVTVDPDRRYRAALWMSAPRFEPVCMARSNTVETPPEMRP